jgi:hypothetical protein
MSDHPLFVIAMAWETIQEPEREPLRKCITDLVKYPCKLACNPNHGSVDIYVFSIARGKVTDWLELQPDGAIGVVFDSYSGTQPDELSDRCEDYNAALNVVFESESESEDSESGSSSEEKE